jgi:hypothetical protein
MLPFWFALYLLIVHVIARYRRICLDPNASPAVEGLLRPVDDLGDAVDVDLVALYVFPTHLNR